MTLHAFHRNYSIGYFFKAVIILAFDFAGQKLHFNPSSITSNDGGNTLIRFDEWLCHAGKPGKLINMNHAIFSQSY